ncbi:indolepyruvate oxidoreductase subunit beta family protein [Vandammella animalimorsus]|uniref:Indolepyruvate oxidoreductase subunit B n=1 Tax=Vandammella animalimorsus TaxID=2029117 RepID=A0A2A2B104_9BURK|nr:indolepyruvate oxidoreductase subunit beta family protein [Vandammella animalimorsus]PAT43738.1 indolepyruvate oxidoreductase subunit B [Vandammella animalimorsus]
MGAQAIKIAILAMGGEGGGVLADWIVNLGEHQDYIAQTTSVPGVAQRTGATIYYVELFPKAEAERAGQQPVLALMPLPGDVDVVLASELMEAGRAVQRGLVTPDRTTLIASTHRVYSIAEKSAMGDGRVDSRQLLAHADAAAQRFIHFDMAEAAQQAGSVISAVLFGALAGSGVLPFTREQFEATIERGGIGVKASLKAFGAAYAKAQAAHGQAAEDASQSDGPPAEPPPYSDEPELRALIEQVQRDFPPAQHARLYQGLRRLVDYQDPAYARLYLKRLQALQAQVGQSGGQGGSEVLHETARHLALWMSYEDTPRVADLKTRASRFERVRAESQAGEQMLHIHEFMHPRLQEVCETLPAPAGHWLMQSGLPRRIVERLTRKGRVVHTNSLHGYLLLRAVAWAARWRQRTTRYARENAMIEDWLARITAAVPEQPALALEIARCQNLVKGYSDTHERGQRNYRTLMQAIDTAQAQGSLTPALLESWRKAALADEHGHELRETLAASGIAIAIVQPAIEEHHHA